MPLFLVAGAVVALGLLTYWGWEAWQHRIRLEGLDLRIHVNGIRGKSTVTRLVAGLLREAGYVTVAKSTGTFAAVIGPDGVDIPIERAGAPTILEQIDVVRRHVTPDVEALVMECMAINPLYQEVSETKIVRSTIGVLTNVREDHQDVMGETLKEIARSLMSTCPRNGTLITAEQNPALQRVILREAAARGTRVVFADPSLVTEEDLARFDYIAFPDNVAIGLVLARLLGIPREVAMEGMVKAPPDPGVLRLRDLRVGPKKVTWANLFAVNDRESMVAAMEKVAEYVTPETTLVGILNNRSDRELRAIQFADVAVNDLSFDRLVTFGAFEELVTDRLVDLGYPLDRIINLGSDRKPTLDEIIDKMVLAMPTHHVLVVGFVNIHTDQAELLMEFFEHEAEPYTDSTRQKPPT